MASSEDVRYVYPMAVVEKMTGLSRRRIRYYEKAGLLKPSRTEGGHRLYSPENVDTLNRIRNIVESGIGTMEAVRRMMAAGLDRQSSTPKTQPAPASRSTRPSFWAARPDMGDAAVRVMRPVDVPMSSPGRGPETDSPSYFRRVSVMTETERRPNN